MRAASKPWPRCAAVTSMFACSGAIGSAAKRSPWGVTRSVSSIADIARNRPCASFTAAAGGGSRQGRLAGSGTPQRAQSSTNPARSASMISGGSKGTRPSVSAASHSRIATPGAVRPARPARWVTAAWLDRTVTKRDRPTLRSSCGRRDRPESTTTRTPSMVILVSAMLVASTILRRPGGGGAMAARWSLASRVPCRRNRSVSVGSRASRRSAVRSISATPGRKARMEPVSLTSAPRIALAMASSSRSAELRPT